VAFGVVPVSVTAPQALYFFFFFARIPCTFIPCPQLFTPLSPNRRIRLEYSTDTFSIAPNTNGTRAGGVKRLLQSVKPVAGRRMALI